MLLTVWKTPLPNEKTQKNSKLGENAVASPNMINRALHMKSTFFLPNLSPNGVQTMYPNTIPSVCIIIKSST